MLLTPEDGTLFFNALILLLMSAIFILCYGFAKEYKNKKLEKAFLILASIFFAPNVIFLFLKGLGAFIYVLTIFFK